jgi:adenosylhomocysteine nucleosidase
MTTAIVSAMQEELAAVLPLLQAQPEEVAGRTFWRGVCHGEPVVAVLSRIGKVAAATTATTLIERFGVSRIVFTGVAGGLSPQVRVGDVVVANEFLQHDLDASPLFPRYEVPLYGSAHFSVDTALTASLLVAAQQALPRLLAQLPMTSRLGLPLDQARVLSGLVVSGDRFVSSHAESQDLQQRLPDALAVEMEGAAMAQVCHDYQVPFAAVRIISDRADDDATVDFLHFIREIAARYSAEVMSALMQHLAAWRP